MAADITLALLRPLIRQRGDYLSSLTFKNDYIDSEIQAAFREWYELVDESNEGFWDTEGTVTTTAAQAYVALPANTWRVHGIDLLSGSDYIPLDQVTRTDRARFSSSQDQPRAYRLSSRGAELYPTPNQAYTLRVLYTPVCPGLSESTGTEMYDLQEFVIVGALLRMDQRSKRALGERQTELERQRQRVVSSANKRKSQEPEYLQLREHGYWEDIY